jgi:hypothetical protein
MPQITTKAKFTAYDPDATGPRLYAKTIINIGIAETITQETFDTIINEILKVATIKHISPFVPGPGPAGTNVLVVFIEGVDIEDSNNFAGTGYGIYDSFTANGSINVVPFI